MPDYETVESKIFVSASFGSQNRYPYLKASLRGTEYIRQQAPMQSIKKHISQWKADERRC